MGGLPAFSDTDQHGPIALVEEAKTDGTKQRWIERPVELTEQGFRPYDGDEGRRPVFAVRRERTGEVDRAITVASSPIGV